MPRNRKDAAAVSESRLPRGWIRGGDAPSSAIHVEVLEPTGKRAASVRLINAASEQFFTVMQQFRADRYRGQRWRFAACVRTVNARRWGGLWMRVDEGKRSIAFDNMQSRPLVGTQDWQPCAVVLDVSPHADLVAFGVLLVGAGMIEMKDLSFEQVDLSVATTGSGTALLLEPVNLELQP